MTTATQQLYWEDVVEGQDIPSFSRKTGLMEWNRFAAANEEHVSFHMDHKAGEAMGAPGAFGMGNLRFAYLHNMLEDWIGADGAIKKVGVQYRDRNFEGETLTAWGKVVRKYVADGEHLVDLELGVRKETGRDTTPGHAIVSLPSRS